MKNPFRKKETKTNVKKQLDRFELKLVREALNRDRKREQSYIQ